ncbi:uncharacterized protein LOC128723841, partial [Anopheles nili]|uniref:uncharacterized protein LOC128723841 n=1 Tax=Anopheles nili TaxID=185578 RepID=UPI00237C5009
KPALSPTRTMLLFEAVQGGDHDRVRHLLDGGADVNARDDKFFNTALHRAVFARRNRPEMVALLVARGADCNALNKRRLTASELALANGLEEVARQLVRAEAQHLDDHLAYYLLIRRGNLQLFEYLIAIKRLRYEDEIRIIARAYGELRLKNVPLREPMEAYLNEILINHDYWLRNGVSVTGVKGRPGGDWLRGRVVAIVEGVQALVGGYDPHDLTAVDGAFLLRLAGILESVFFVRNQYKALPLHHLEFCIGIFLHIWKNPPRYDIYKMLVDKRRLLLYLGAVANELKKILVLPVCGAPVHPPVSIHSDDDVTLPVNASKTRPKFRWTSERNRELMFCHYVVAGDSEHANYRARLHELWTERQRTATSVEEKNPSDISEQQPWDLSEQNLLTQQRRITRDALLPEDIRRRTEREAHEYRRYNRPGPPKLSDRNRKVFRKMATSYRRMRELHALNRVLAYIDAVSELDWAQERDIKTLAMRRVVQVICETLRHGRDTPAIGRHLESFVNVLAPRRILRDARIRDYLAHYRHGGGDLLAQLTQAHSTGGDEEQQQREDASESQEGHHLALDAGSVDCEELYQRLGLVRNLFVSVRNRQHLVAVKTLINRLYDSRCLEEIKSYYAYLFRHNAGELDLPELEFAPFALLEIGALLEAISELLRNESCGVNERIERMRERVSLELDGYRVLHRQFGDTILMVDSLMSKIKSNHSYEKLRHTFRSHLKVFQRARPVDVRLLEHLRTGLLGYLYEDLPELRHGGSELERRLAMLVCHALYALNRKLYDHQTTCGRLTTLHLTDSGDGLLRRLEEATGKRLTFLVHDPAFTRLRDNPTKRYDQLRQLLRRHRVLYSESLLADLRREEERETEQKVAQLQQLFLDQNMNARAFDRVDELAFEMLMLEATSALSGKLSDNRASLCNYVPVLTGRNLRNYLAHGHITYELLIPNTGPKTIRLNALSIIKLSKNIISEIYDRHGWEHAEKLAVLQRQEAILDGFRFQSCGEIRETIRAEAYLLGRNHLNQGIVDHLIQHQSCMLLGHLLDFDRVDEFLKPLAYLMESVSAIPCAKPLHDILADVRARKEFCYELAVLSNDEDILSKIVTDFGYGQIDAIPMVFNFDRLFASFLETHPDYDVNAESNAEILHYAVLSGNVELLNLLLDQCHDLNQRDVCNQTPLDVACKLSNVEMVKALTNAGAKWYTNGEHGHSQYAWIFLNNDQDAIVFLKNNELLSGKVAGACVDLFLQYCDDTNEEIVEFMLAHSALEYAGLYPKAVAYRRLNVLRFLFENDRKVEAHVNRKDPTGQGLTPLQLAARAGYTDVVELLLRQGASVLVRDATGNTPLHWAVECGSVRTVRVLLRHGANVAARNTLGKSPLELAIAREHRKLTRVLLHSGHGGLERDITLSESLRSRAILEDLLRVGPSLKCSFTLARSDDSLSDTFTPLHHALDERTAERLLQVYDVDVASPRFRTTPLHLACLCNQSRRVRFLLRHGADPSLANSDGMTPLMLAVTNRNTTIVRTLLSHQLHPRGQDERLNTVLAIAIRKQSIDIANLLLQHGASIDTIGQTLASLSPQHRGVNKSTYQQPHQLFFSAAREGYNRILEYLLASGLFAVDTKDAIGSTALFHALSRAPLETFDILVRHGADVEHCNRFGHNVLSIAAMHNRLDALQYFVNNHPALVRFLGEIETGTSNTVLHLAVLRGALEIVQYCVQLHQDIGLVLDAQNHEGFTALHISAQTGHEAIFGYLLGHGADPTIPSANGQSILHTAICNRNLAIVRAIVQAGALPTEQDLFDDEHRSPLHYAVFSRHVGVVQEVLKLPGLPLNHGDVRGNTALHLAAEFQYIDLYNLLRKRIDNELRNGHGKRAIDVLLRK